MGSGECSPGDRVDCGVVGRQTCSTMCEFSDCSTPTTGLQFESSSQDTVVLSSAPALGSGSFTVGAWIRASGTQSVSLPTIFSTRALGAGGSKTGWRFGISNQTGFLGRLYIGNDESVWLASAGTDLRDNTWHHVGVIRVGETVSFYVDRVLVDTETIMAGATFSSPEARIGNDTILLDQPFNGRISDVRVHDRQLSALEIGSPIPTAFNLVARWELDGSGSSVEESRGRHDGHLGEDAAADSHDPLRVSLP